MQVYKTREIVSTVIQYCVQNTYPHRNFDKSEQLIIYLTMSKRVWFFLFATSFYCGILGANNWDTIPLSNIYLSKLLERYSPPRLDQSNFMLLFSCFSASVWIFLNFSNAWVIINKYDCLNKAEATKWQVNKYDC